MKSGAKQVSVAQKHSIKALTLGGFMRDKTKILAAATSLKKYKRISKGKEHDLEEQLYA